jgi:hypothetical protein
LASIVYRNKGPGIQSGNHDRNHAALGEARRVAGWLKLLRPSSTLRKLP